MNDKQRLLRLEKEVLLLKKALISLLSESEDKICYCGREKTQVQMTGDINNNYMVCLNPDCRTKS